MYCRPIKFGKYCIFLVSFLCFACKTTQPNYITSENLSEFFRYSPDKTPKISIHRGGGDVKGYPENCLESFAYFSKRMPSIIECDIELTKDSVMILMHDDKLDRTTNGTGKISTYTYNELSKFRLKDNYGNLTKYRIPKLEDVLIWGKGKVVFTLDVKKNTPYRMVTDMVEKIHAEQYAAIITYNFDQCQQVHMLNPNLMISASIMQPNDFERIKEAGIQSKRLIAFIGTREPKTEIIELMHSKNIMCILGTLGNLDKKAALENNKPYLDYLHKGIDIFATDRPDAVYEVIFNKKPK
ncbi:MAG: glycerophosphodiester phosphodiesterase family protein [Leadbetterella sp.]